MADELENWNRRYREGSHSSMTPDPFLIRAWEDFISPVFPRGGHALDVAGGIGRHAIWLAKRKWHVTLLDISDVGIARAKANAGDCGPPIDYRVTDLKLFSAPEQKYELVLVFFYLERAIFPELLKALAPGGLLVYKTYTVDQPKFGDGPSHPMHLLKENELLHSFPDLRVLFYKETIRDRGVAEFLGRKP